MLEQYGLYEQLGSENGKMEHTTSKMGSLVYIG